MALQEGEMSDTKLTTSEKSSRKDTIQKIIQNIKNSEREFVGGSSSVNNLHAEGAVKDHGRINNQNMAGGTRDRNNTNIVLQAQRPLESRRKAKNPTYFRRRKLVAGKNKSTSPRPFKIYNGFIDENYSASLNSFNEFTLPTDEDELSMINSPENTCKEESFELVLDGSGTYTINPYSGPCDHQTLCEEKLKINTRVQRNGEEVEGCLTISRNECTLPWSWSRRQNGRGKKLKGIGRKRFSCGVLGVNKRKALSDSANTLRYQEPIQFEYVTDFASSDCCYSKEKNPLIRSPHPNIFTLDSYLDEYCGSPHASNRRFSELDLLTLTRTHNRTRQSGTSEFETEEESIHKRTNENISVSRSLNQKYSPKSFKELVGQSIIAQALSNAITKDKIAPFYLFHGPRGTGKTSAARIFGFGLNCIAVCNAKPCGNCKGCSKSPNITEMDATRSCVGIESMKVLLQSIAYSESDTRYRVFIVDECQILTPESWAVLLNGIEEGSCSVVFIMITTDSTKLPRLALSRCQKFYFPKLRDTDICMKLEKVAAAENIDIEEDALHLITAKADGSLREAETILDQLSLFGTKVTTTVVRQFVGLIPDEKLVNLLGLALSADSKRTVRSTREIIESGIEPLVLITQLASLITDILAGSCIQSAWLDGNTRLFGGDYSSKDESEWLRQALKILSETEKQLRSSTDHTTWLTAALLQLAPDVYPYSPPVLHTNITQAPVPLLDTLNKEITRLEPWSSDDRWENDQLQVQGIGPKSSEMATDTKSGEVSESGQKDLKPISLLNTQEIWTMALEGIQAAGLKEFLLGRGKLVSVFLCKAYAIVHLKFWHPQDKYRARRSGVSISNVFQEVLGCAVELKLTVGSSTNKLEHSESSVDFSCDERDVLNSQEKKTLTSKAVRRRNTKAARKRNRYVGMPREMREASESHRHRLQAAPNDYAGLKECSIDQDSSGVSRSKGKSQITSTKGKQITNDGHTHIQAREIKQRSFTTTGTTSHSFVQQVKGNVEAYSQDLLFDQVGPAKKLGKGRSSKVDTQVVEVKEANSHSKQVNSKQVNMERGDQSRCGALLCCNELHRNRQKWKQRRVGFLLKFAPCTESRIRVGATELKKKAA